MTAMLARPGSVQKIIVHVQYSNIDAGTPWLGPLEELSSQWITGSRAALEPVDWQTLAHPGTPWHTPLALLCTVSRARLSQAVPVHVTEA